MKGQICNMTQQMMEEPRITEIQLRRFGQAFAYVAKIGREATHQKRAFENIHIPLHGMVRDAQGLPKLRRIEQTALRVRKHGQRAPE
jgi:hypothetical protein